MILTIDPGAAQGWAMWESLAPDPGAPAAFAPTASLVACGLGEVPRGVRPAEAVIEKPVIYPGGKTRNPNSLITLAISAGIEAGILHASGVSIRWVEPRAWKGTIDPDVVNRRTLARLNPSERAVYDSAVAKVAESKRHNVLDAIGIGLWVAGRLNGR